MSDQGAEQKFGSLVVTEIDAKTLLTPAKGFIGSYDFTLNPYRGCQYGCSYCYAAAFSPNQGMRQAWGNWVVIKENAVELLSKELTRWQRKKSEPCRIYMSTVTDPYQPIETRWYLTRRLLEIMIEFQPILVIQTRSPMIIRDLDLLNQLQQLRVNMSIPTGSELVRKDFEPRTPSVKARLKAIQRVKNTTTAKCSVTITPLLPIYPADQLRFIDQLQTVDRVVIQPFHSSQARTLVASTRSEAVILKEKYTWWYQDENNHYQQFKKLLEDHLADVQEGQIGFGYE